MIVTKTTSERIKEALEIRGMKQTELVEKTGISKGALSSYVSGKYVPKQTNTYKIAKALEVDISWLMGADVPMEGKHKYELASMVNKLRNDLKAQELLSLYYNHLSDENRERLLDLAKALGNN